MVSNKFSDVLITGIRPQIDRYCFLNARVSSFVKMYQRPRAWNEIESCVYRECKKQNIEQKYKWSFVHTIHREIAASSFFTFEMLFIFLRHDSHTQHINCYFTSQHHTATTEHPTIHHILHKLEKMFFKRLVTVESITFPSKFCIENKTQALQMYVLYQTAFPGSSPFTLNTSALVSTLTSMTVLN